MKKYILLNLTGLFVFFLFTCMFISCGKSGNPPASTKKKTTPQKSGTTQFTPQMVMEAIEYMAEKLPEEDREDFLDDSPLKDLYRTTDSFNRAMGEGELKVSEISGKALGEALYQKMFGSDRGGLSKARAKANRIKCVNNLGMIGKAMLGFSQDNGSRTPWNFAPSQQRNHFGSNYNLTVGSIFGLAAMKSEVQTAKILISPCDKGRFAANEKVQEDWRNYNTKGGNPIPHDGLSYGLCLGGDFQRPATVIAMTRNLATDDLAKSNWLGADEGESPLVKKRAMSGLTKSQGQLVMADGSAKQSTDADLGALGKIIRGHINARGGTSPLGDSRTKVMLPY
ncbi:MAG: hypothetical protein H8E27_05875 [Verrucomicrobia subdivision 3 bacterium]|nr:hypothetical protein [Limisphaerales bacterium]